MQKYSMKMSSLPICASFPFKELKLLSFYFRLSIIMELKVAKQDVSKYIN